MKEGLNMQSVIIVDNVSKYYKTYKRPSDRLKEIITLGKKKYHNSFKALQNISFEVKKGTTVGIIGTNGSGKSTILKIILGTLTPSIGNVRVQGKIASLLELGAGFNPELTGKENVFLYGSIMGMDKKEIDIRFNDITNFADIGDFLEQPVKTYSSGMFVRLAFSCAVHCDPDVMIIDEALSVGDMYFQQKSMKKIRELKDSGKSILFVSHDVQAVISLCDEVVWIEKGELRDKGEPKVVAKAYQMSIHDMQQEKQDLQPKKNTNSNVKKIVNIDSRYGDGKAEIVGMDVSVNGVSVDTIQSGDEVCVKTYVSIKEDLEMPIVGLTIRDRLSNIVFSTNSNIEEYYLKAFKANEEIAIEFKFTWPYLQPGNYSLSPAIANGTQENHVMCDWIENAMIVKSFSTKEIIGLMGLGQVTVSYSR
jgi:ABC-type polysaccharide/polyol phosphate transport system ATPase subunit